MSANQSRGPLWPIPCCLRCLGGRFVFPIIHRATRALHRRFCRLVEIEGSIDQRDMR